VSLYAKMIEEIDSTRNEKYKNLVWDEFMNFVVLNKLEVKEVLTRDGIGKFLVERVEKLNGSAKTVNQVYWNIKSKLEEKGLSLSKKNSREIKQVIRKLEYKDMVPTRKSYPLTMKYLFKMFHKKVLKGPDLMFAVIATIGHAGMFRLDTLISDLKVKNVLWSPDRNSFKLSIGRTKTHRKGGALFISFETNGSPVCPVLYLRQWFNECNLWNVKEASLFPSMSHGRLNFNKTISGSWIRRKLKREISKLGLDASLFSGHSFRAGGATDMFVLKIPYYIIKKRGKWVSDAAMLYYRDEDSAEQAIFEALRVLSSAELFK
jgi:hypothetical protein